MKALDRQFYEKIECLRKIGDSIVGNIIVHGCLSDRKAKEMWEKKMRDNGKESFLEIQ